MLAEMRKRQLAGQKSIAEDELEYEHTQINLQAHVYGVYVHCGICCADENAFRLCRQF